MMPGFVKNVAIKIELKVEVSRFMSSRVQNMHLASECETRPPHPVFIPTARQKAKSGQYNKTE